MDKIDTKPYVPLQRAYDAHKKNVSHHENVIKKINNSEKKKADLSHQCDCLKAELCSLEEKKSYSIDNEEITELQSRCKQIELEYTNKLKKLLSEKKRHSKLAVDSSVSKKALNETKRELKAAFKLFSSCHM